MWRTREGETPYYKLSEWHAMFGYTFAGSVEELATACRDILDGKEVIIPVFASTPFVRDMVLTHWHGKYEELPLARLKAGPKITRIPEWKQRNPWNRDDPEWDLLVGTGSGRVKQLPGFLNKLGDPDPAVRIQAARQIGGIGGQAKHAIPQLAKLLDDDRATVRTAAAGAILQLDPKHATARTALRNSIKDKAPAVRRSVAEWLWILDRDVEGTAADLVTLQGDMDADVRTTATQALKSLLTAYDLKPLTPDELRAASESPDKECARHGATELPSLREAVNRQQEIDIRITAAEWLWLSERKADAVLGVLNDALSAKDAVQHRRAAALLGRIGPSAAASAPLLKRALNDADESVSQAAAQALKTINPTAGSRGP